MNLTETPEIVLWPPTHFVYVERIGPFMKTAREAWGTAYSLAPLVTEHNQISGKMSLYRMSPHVYRAGFALAAAPVKLPRELSYELLEGGRYLSFVLTGPYSDLPAATARAWEIVSKNDIMVRTDFAIEHYVSDQSITPEDKLVTQILIPTD